MSQPRRSEAESEAIRSSHSEFINQVLKAPISSRPPSGLRQWESSSSPKRSNLFMDEFMFRNLFNHIDFVATAQRLGYELFYHDWKPAAPGLWGPDVYAVILRCVSRHREVMFIVHAYLTSDLTILGADGMLDPKDIFLQDQIKISGKRQVI